MSFTHGGKYPAKIVAAKLTETKSGEPQTYMQFEANDNGTTQLFDYYGGFGEKSAPHTIKAMVTAGFAGTDVEDLKQQGILAFMPAEISIELEDYKGKLRVKWVNGASKKTDFKGATPKLAGAFAKVKQELGVKPTAKQQDW